jgi:RNA polymerase sigma-70 factor (ECF subfamily)
MTIKEYNTCVDLHSDGVYRFILKNIRDDDRAKDIVQDTFEKLWLKVSSIDYTTAKSYLYTAAYHTMIDAIRKEKVSSDIEAVEIFSHTPSKPFHDIKKVIDKALSRLNHIQRSVIMLRDYEGYSYDEIGDITGLNESQVKVYIYRARIAMKEYIVSIDNVV